MLGDMLTLEPLTRCWSFFLFVKNRVHPEKDKVMIIIKSKILLETHFETLVNLKPSKNHKQ